MNKMLDDKAYRAHGNVSTGHRRHFVGVAKRLGLIQEEKKHGTATD